MMARYRPGTGDLVRVFWRHGGHELAGAGTVVGADATRVVVRLSAAVPGVADHPTKGAGHRDWREGDVVSVPAAGQGDHPSPRVERID